MTHFEEIRKIEKEAENPHESPECICRSQLCLWDSQKVYVHLIWCPDSYAVKEYDALPWHKKIFTFNPRNHHSVKC